MFALNLSSVLSHVLLVHLLNNNGKDIGYQWEVKKLIRAWGCSQSLTWEGDCCCVQVTGTRQGLAGMQHSQCFVPPLFMSFSIPLKGLYGRRMYWKG